MLPLLLIASAERNPCQQFEGENGRSCAQPPLLLPVRLAATLAAWRASFPAFSLSLSLSLVLCLLASLSATQCALIHCCFLTLLLSLSASPVCDFE